MGEKPMSENQLQNTPAGDCTLAVLADYIQQGNQVCGKISAYASQILDEVFGLGQWKFPISMERVAQHYGVNVLETDLAKDSEGESSQLLSVLIVRPEIYTEGVSKTIFVDSNTTLFLQRFALAHAFAYFMLAGRCSCTHEYCSMPTMQAGAEDQAADALALALLFPPSLCEKELAYFVEAQGTQFLQHDQWIMHLCLTAQAAYNYAALADQQFRLLRRIEKENL